MFPSNSTALWKFLVGEQICENKNYKVSVFRSSI